MRLLLPVMWAFSLSVPGAFAQAYLTCVPPITDPRVPGEAAFYVVSPTCKGADVANSYGSGPPPAATQAPLAAVKTWQPPARETQRVEIPQPTDEQAEPSAASGDFGYNTRQSLRLGQLDAMQGRPMNMKYAGNLAYLEGYTKGQEARAKAGMRGQGAGKAGMSGKGW